jgi:hypothetical protein
MEANLGFWRFGRRGSHKLTDGFEEGTNGGVVALDAVFQFSQLAGKLSVGGEGLAELHESAHDGDVDLDGTPAAQDAGKHGHALLGKGIR